ncbi:hypothetical protein AMS68_002694 [Peltaster fructicola]|uniref:Peroxisomal targeting signal receptor n=1 Tax=Peltaster fructicola TaxID=286661 RepID=A0A6H0XQZ5_9PEZI|nr:hypothetical protein AMS68_002694 [Peltaster fructicola]
MSFLGGPECSTAANPLAQFQKQTQSDTSLQRDRLTSRQPGNLGFRSQGGSQAEEAAFHEFSQQGAPLFNAQVPNEPFHFEQLRREAERIERNDGWASEFAGNGLPGMEQMKMNSGPAWSSNEFAKFREGQSHAQARFENASPVSQGMSQQYRPMYGGYSSMQRPMFQSQFLRPSEMQQQNFEGKGKGRVQELSDTDWEKQFEELSTEDQRLHDYSDQLDEEANKAIEEELNGIDRAMAATEDEYDQWKDFDGDGAFDDLRTLDADAAREVGNYMFEEDNIFKDVPNAYEEGLKILREGGNLSLAALAFEAAVQKDTEFVEAWVALGQAQAQNEKEVPAIRALEHALKIDPNNLDALMGLSVSYTNESFDSLAYRTLERWISIKYPQLNVQPRGLGEAAAEDLTFTDRHILHERVTELFLEAAMLNPEGSGVDVDVQVGLGVLFYGSEDYDKAVDCFTVALNSAQHGSMKREGEEHLLWNRLGATLANSGRSEDAIEAYGRALEIRPNFVRARYNLAVSSINLSCYEEAATHLLGALSMHKVMEAEGRQKAAELLKDGNGNDVPDRVVDEQLQQNQSTNILDTLRRVFTQMDRRDLAEKVGADMDINVFRKEFDF